MAVLLPNSVFVHVPKTGGQWIAAALENAGLFVGTLGVVHASPDEIEHEEAYRSRSAVFAFVRNPFTWYQSMWAHRMDEEWEAIDDLEWFTPRWIEIWADFSAAAQSSTFDEFVRGLTAHYPQGFLTSLYEAYTGRCTHVGRYERLVEDLLGILSSSEPGFRPRPIVATKPRNVRGSTPRRRKEAVYTGELSRLVARVERNIFQRYRYADVAA